MPVFDISLLQPLHAGDFALAWGWWLLLVVIIFSIALLSLYIGRKWYKNSYRRFALCELLACDPFTLSHASYLQQVNKILKFTAMHTFNTTEVAALTGNKWLVFLDQHWHKKKYTSFVRTTGAMLEYIPYMKNYTANMDDLMHLQQLAATWIKKHKC
jgi:hypothetical protein